MYIHNVRPRSCGLWSGLYKSKLEKLGCFIEKSWKSTVNDWRIGLMLIAEISKSIVITDYLFHTLT